MEGLTPGMALTDARVVFPAVDVVMADSVADAELLDTLTAWCGRYTPWAAGEGRDGIFLDVTGCAHLFGGEAALCADLTRRLEGFGFTVRVAMADTPGAAWAMAHFGASGTIVPAGGARAALARLPVSALRLDPATVGGLARVGVRKIFDLRSMPRAPLTKTTSVATTLTVELNVTLTGSGRHKLIRPCSARQRCVSMVSCAPHLMVRRCGATGPKARQAQLHRI